jgi:hypothetical protein
MSDAKETIATAVKSAPKARRSKKDKPAVSHEDASAPYDITFPPDCPIEPLGINGDDVYFLDQKRQLAVLKSDKLNMGTIRALFGNLQELKYAYWPRFSKPDENGRCKVNGWRPEQAADCLYAEASRKGLWDVLERVRGPGCWRDADGKLVMHCGDLLFHDGQAMTPRQIGRHVYPSAPAGPHPMMKTATTKEIEQLLTLLKTWSWRRPDVDPYLLLGWIGASIMGGALKWRPLVWVTGDKAMGKSTLHDVIKGVLGPGGIVNSTDATAAGLWQTVGHASIPVALDEIEAEQDNRKAQNIIKLARQAASGGQTLRGGSDHKNASFTVRSCFLFSSILIPPMLGQDISRMAVLELDKLPEKAKPPSLDEKMLEQIGAAIRARIMQQWDRFPDLLLTWQTQLVQAGHSGRSADQFGTLLACYDLLTSDYEPDTEAKEKWSLRLAKQGLAECEQDIADHERCISYLMTTQLDLYRSGERRTVGSWIIQAAGKDKVNYHTKDIEDANKALGNVGLMVKELSTRGASGGFKYHVLYVANDHQGLAGLFANSHWSGNSGTNGVWVQAMRRVKGAQADQQRFNGLKKRCTAIPLTEVIGADDEKE